MGKRRPIRVQVEDTGTPMTEDQFRRWSQNYLRAVLELEGYRFPPSAGDFPPSGVEATPRDPA